MRIAFVFSPGTLSSSWIGGLNYFRSLFTSIRATSNGSLSIVIVTAPGVDLLGLADYANEIVRTRLMDNASPLKYLRKLLQFFFRKDILLYYFLRDLHIDCVSHGEYLWRGRSIPCLSWIADFQELHLPDYFSNEVLAQRRHRVELLRKYSDAILFSSCAAQRDFFSLYPDSTLKTYVLSFAAAVQADCLAVSLDQIEKLYGLTQPWFHVPNQFWLHKNHQIVIDALDILKSRGINMHVVATGSTKDWRDDKYFPRLAKQIVSRGLEKNFRVLGIVPYEHMLALMRYSVAVINPSLFEGWSTVVEESRALGKEILLSDIAVHREQDPPRGKYFSAHIAEQLATLMKDSYSALNQVEEDVRFAEGMNECVARQRAVGDAYKEILIDLCENNTAATYRNVADLAERHE